MRRLLTTIRRAAADYDAALGAGSARRDSITFAAIVPVLLCAAVLFAAMTGRL